MVLFQCAMFVRYAPSILRRKNWNPPIDTAAPELSAVIKTSMAAPVRGIPVMTPVRTVRTRSVSEI